MRMNEGGSELTEGGEVKRKRRREDREERKGREERDVKEKNRALGKGEREEKKGGGKEGKDTNLIEDREERKRD